MQCVGRYVIYKPVKVIYCPIIGIPIYDLWQWVKYVAKGTTSIATAIYNYTVLDVK